MNKFASGVAFSVLAVVVFLAIVLFGVTSADNKLLRDCQGMGQTRIKDVVVTCSIVDPAKEAK